ncbi:unnamed protein product [Linum tenue]|uniref:Gamma-interferon-inducible lysosomal thiol reductase n=1 Tax=Linum tenue TaxID=586396 RepID=A0AAV0PUF2_9ROSI|nr:unnamed protein product [Linum tenue]
MAPSLFTAIFLLSFAFLPFHTYSSSFVASHLEADIGTSNQSSFAPSDQKVNLSVYYESLCPACAQFIVQNLLTIFNNGLIDIVNLRLIPWGNARFIGMNNTIICQNGHEECQLNTVQACSIDILHDVDKSYALISCMELFVIEGKHNSWHECFESLGLSDQRIVDCYNSANGTKLDVLLSQETSSLVPPPTFVPWIVVNKLSIGKDYGNFTVYVCNEYKGQPAPAACNSLPPQGSKVAVSNLDNLQACHKKEAMNLTSLDRLRE